MSLEIAEAYLATLGNQKDQQVLDLLSMITDLRLDPAQSAGLIEHIRLMCRTSTDILRAQDYMSLQRKEMPESCSLIEYKSRISRSIRKSATPLPAKSYK